MTLALPSQRWRIAMSGFAAALLLMLILGTSQGRSAAAQFLAQFRGERLPSLRSGDPVNDTDASLVHLIDEDAAAIRLGVCLGMRKDVAGQFAEFHAEVRADRGHQRVGKRVGVFVGVDPVWRNYVQEEHVVSALGEEDDIV